MLAKMSSPSNKLNIGRCLLCLVQSWCCPFSSLLLLNGTLGKTSLFSWWAAINFMMGPHKFPAASHNKIPPIFLTFLLLTVNTRHLKICSQLHAEAGDHLWRLLKHTTCVPVPPGLSNLSLTHTSQKTAPRTQFGQNGTWSGKFSWLKLRV